MGKSQEGKEEPGITHLGHSSDYKELLVLRKLPVLWKYTKLLIKVIFFFKKNLPVLSMELTVCLHKVEFYFGNVVENPLN